MAGQRSTNLVINVDANDQASAKIDRLQKKVDGLESDEARIVIKAETERLERQLDTAKKKLEGLDGDEASVQLRAIGNLEADLEAAQQLFKELDGKTGTVRINAVDNASADIDKVSDRLRQLDGDSATVRVDTGGSGSSLGGGVATGAAAGAAGLAAGLALAAQNAADTAIQVQAISTRTGASLETVSRLVAVFADNGVEASDLADILYNVNGVLRDNPELADQLGVKINKNTDLVDLFLQAVEGVETQFTDVGDAAVAASQLFGEEGVRQVDTVTASVGELDTAMQGVSDQRLITDDDVQAARDINTELAKTKAYTQEIALALLPIINGALGGTIGLFNGINDAGAAVRDFLFPNNTVGSTSLTEQGTIARNTGGFFGGAYGGVDASGYSTAPRGRASGNVTIINPPGTPAAYVDGTRIYQRRNGIQ